MAKTTDFLRRDYDKLIEKSKQVILVQSINAIVEWDMETKMPPKAVNLRSQQMGMLGQLDHKMSTDREIGKLIEKIRRHPNFDSLSEIEKRNVHLIKKNYDEKTKLPEDLVVAMATQAAVAVNVWKRAKAAKDFAMFKPDLEKLVELKRKSAEILMKVKGTKTPYDALIDMHEPSMTSEMITRLFDELRIGLVSITKKCVNSPKKPDNSFLWRKVPIDAQQRIANSLAKVVGYDVESPNAGGRIDETEHPFTQGYYDDVRITTHYFENNFTSSIFSILHEAGHAMYDQNLRQEWMFQPVGTGCSYGFHESQSRFVENIFGRSREFWSCYLPELKKLMGNVLSDVTLDNFVHAVNQVKPSKIRIEADEVTYGLHVIIRFNIERDLFANKIEVADLPGIWNEKYMEYLGVKVENDSEGVMQDTHWGLGYFGYFPTYALGNIYDGQIFALMKTTMPNWKDYFAKGNFQPVRQWLAKNVHSYGNLYDPADLMRKIVGKEINVKDYLDYLNEKYSKLYGY
jgi:carboxypeptidase Taq